MSNSVRPHRQQPTRLPCPWDSPGKNTGVGCHFLLQCRKVKSESEVTQSCPTLRPQGLQPTRLLLPWDFPGKSTRVGCHCHMKRCSTLVRKIQVEINEIPFPTHLKAIIKMRDNNKYWQGCGEIGNFIHYWQECKVVQPLWNSLIVSLESKTQSYHMTQRFHSQSSGQKR